MNCKNAGAPRPPDRPARTGRRKPDRTPPARMPAEAFSRVPARLLRDPALSATARLVGAEVAALAGDAPHTFATNARIQENLGLGRNAVTSALAELEVAGWIYRLLQGDAPSLAKILMAGGADPWAGREGPGLKRGIILLWAIPPAGSRPRLRILNRPHGRIVEGGGA